MKIEPVKINKEQFEAVCLDIISDPNYHKEKYMQIAKDKIQTHYLKLSLQ